MHKIIALALLVLVGCGRTPAPGIPPTAGDFVKNDKGAGTARVFGIDFSARVNSGGASAVDAIEAKFVDPELSGARKSFALGDEIKITLDSIDESEVRFSFNGQSFGTLHVGDKVVIDDERKVEVNGAPRSPKPAE